MKRIPTEHILAKVRGRKSSEKLMRFGCHTRNQRPESARESLTNDVFFRYTKTMTYTHDADSQYHWHLPPYMAPGHADPLTNTNLSIPRDLSPPEQLPSSTYQDRLPCQTSDLNTRLTQAIKRRCFNCCTTDTSAWRRSRLNRGKLVSLHTNYAPSVYRLFG